MSSVRNVFDVLEDDAQEYGTRRAAIVAVARAKKQMGAFFKQAASEEEFTARLGLVEEKLREIVREACIENTTTDFDTVSRVLANELAHYAEVMRDTIPDKAVPPTEGEDDYEQPHIRGINGDKLLGLGDDNWAKAGGKTAFEFKFPEGAGDEAPHEHEPYEDTTCPECGGKGCASCHGTGHADGMTPLDRAMREGAAKTAVETGDTYTQETVDLPAAGPSGLSEDPSPKLDPSSAGDELHTSQKPIDVPSVANPVEQQDINEHADYTKELDVPGVKKEVNADTPMQPENPVAPNTQAFPNKDQANPVTSKWKLVS